VILALTLALPVAAAAAGSGASAPGERIKVTFVGDSIAASLDYVTGARSKLTDGLDARLDFRVCRRLATPSCPYRGSKPPSALAIVRASGARLGDVLVVDVGYNEGSGSYREGMRQVIRTALADGVRGIVWVTLRETRDIYHETNVAIRAEAKRWPQVVVADWNGYSAGRPWFRDDGLHLNTAGAEGLAAMLRPLVARAARASCGEAPPRCKA
jgi:hypothetical protein